MRNRHQALCWPTWSRSAATRGRDGTQHRWPVPWRSSTAPIVCRVRAGDRVLAGDRIGLIRFGSRVDVDLPPDSRARVAPGDRVVAGESVLADRGSGDEARDMARIPASPV